MPWARAARRGPSLAPQKSVAKPPIDTLGSPHSGSDFDAALLAEEQERVKEEAELATAVAQHKDVGTVVSSSTCGFAGATRQVHTRSRLVYTVDTKHPAGVVCVCPVTANAVT